MPYIAYLTVSFNGQNTIHWCKFMWLYLSYNRAVFCTPKMSKIVQKRVWAKNCPFVQKRFCLLKIWKIWNGKNIINTVETSWHHNDFGAYPFCNPWVPFFCFFVGGKTMQKIGSKKGYSTVYIKYNYMGYKDYRGLIF